MRRSTNQTELAAAFAELGKTLRGAEVVDVGCGDGTFVRHLAREGAKMLGVEVSPEQLACAQSAPNVAGERYARGGGEALPCGASSQDALVYVKSFHHVPVAAMPAALAEAERVLRPGGVVVAIEPLAQGDYFRLLQPLDDESAVRAAALEALNTPPEGLKPVLQRDYLVAIQFRDFDAMVETMVAADARRRSRLGPAEPAMRATFDRAARPVGEAVAFDQPMRIVVLRRA